MTILDTDFQGATQVFSDDEVNGLLK